MVWALDDGSHWGRTMMIMATGELLGADAGEALSAPPAHPWFGSVVVGWAVLCSCGWRGPTWTRVPDPWEMDVTHRLGYSEDDLPVAEVLQGMLHGEWSAHVQPRLALEVLEREVAAQTAAAARLDAAVAVARAQGASWAAVAAAVGISRQSAHQRWAHP